MTRFTLRLVPVALAMSALTVGVARADQNQPTYPYRPLPADKVPLPSLPETPEPTLLPLKAVRLAAGTAPRTVWLQASAVVEPTGGGGCTGPRIVRPGRPGCPAGSR